MHELIVNLHMHTRYSDGTAWHARIAATALRAGLDAIIVTDHNVRVEGPEGYYGGEDRRVLLLIGEEVHDQARQPQKNHLLVFGADRELAQLAPDPQTLIDGVRQSGGICFLAHPIDPPAPKFGQEDLSWVDWDVHGYTGIELWNGMTEFKSLLKGLPQAFFYAYNPAYIPRGPFPETLKKWDELLANGQPVVALGGSDAHALHASLGPLKRTLFPYEFHFKAVNTHVFTPQPLTGDFSTDQDMILDALRQGHAFIGYDLPASTRGFRFVAHHQGGTAWMGDQVKARGGVTLKAHLPHPAEIRILKDSEVVRSGRNRQALVHKATEPGVYRVEAYRHFKGRRRGWVFSNPIYLR